MVVFDYRRVGGLVVGNEEGPAASITVVLVALVQHVAVEEKGVPWVQFNLDQGKNLVCVHTDVHERKVAEKDTH